MEEIATGIWCWQRRPRGLRPGEFGSRTSYMIAAGDGTLLIDPLVDGEDDPVLGALDDVIRGRVRILISKPFHTRSAEPLWRRYRRASARIYGHKDVATRLGDRSGFVATAGGSAVGDVARFLALGSPARSEQPIEIPGCQALIFGDAVVETGEGRLRVWEDPLDTDHRRRWWRERYLPTLTRLADLGARHILVTHGQPVLGRGAVALRGALERDPWQRPRR